MYFKLIPRYCPSLTCFHSNKLMQRCNPLLKFQRINGLESFLCKSNGLSVRTLVTKSVLGLDHFQQRREKYERHFQGKEETFFHQLKKITEESELRIHMEDLKTLIYLCRKSENDIYLIKNLLKKYFLKDGQKLTTFQFGPEIMRLFYFFKDPLTALELIQSEELKDAFCQVTSFTIVMDNLFHSGYYEEIISLFHDMQSRKLTILPFPKEPTYLTIAACFKLNTEKSFEEAMNILEKCISLKINLGLSFYCLTAALAIKLHKFTVAHELISRPARPSMSSYVYLNLLAMALAGVGKTQQATSLLHEIYKEFQHNNLPFKPVFHETIQIIDNSYKEALSDQTCYLEFVKLKKTFEDKEFISYESLDTVVCQDMEERRYSDTSGQSKKSDFNDRESRRRRLAASFSQRDGKQNIRKW